MDFPYIVPPDLGTNACSREDATFKVGARSYIIVACLGAPVELVLAGRPFLLLAILRQEPFSGLVVAAKGFTAT
jgi:hypothetical protein